MHKKILSITICKTEEYNNEPERDIRVQNGLFAFISRMCNRNRKCVEISLCGGTERRRGLCAVLPVVLDDHGGSCAFHGICRREGKPEKSGESLSGA